ncbi:UDP-N-acetylmuramoyl-L-alanyl-D-glutamate--2,6-diaminopimelate ligase [Desertibaculum subflavum]|uniref:UDP-N-acetylmuramoyl-L-alanyl-D-glutamate--2, 6-diaminopimelate ligase n=1 Tax=Desertibaculum subflavum TaxID=2268458 RepID=UPI0034D26707
MRLSELIGGKPPGGSDPEIAGIATDSRTVRPGYLFAALPGTRVDGATFIKQAVGAGAVAVLARSDVKPCPDTAWIADANPRRQIALIAARFYARQPRTIAAVTGTSGKTSVADFTRQLWQATGRPAASLGTLGVRTTAATEKLDHTTPDPIVLHQALDRLAGSGIDHLAIEASSHGLDQARLDGVRIAAAAFTTFGIDHGDYHPTPQDYLAAKLRLFDALLPADGAAVLNADTPVFAEVRAVCDRRSLRVFTYGRGGLDLRIIDAAATPSGQQVTAEIFGHRHTVPLALYGTFQAGNVMAALGLVVATGTPVDAALAVVAGLEGVPGRLQKVAAHPNGAPVFVDYAHKPDALEAVLTALRPHVAGRLHIVFGCGGDRDRAKRPMMGDIARRLADRVIVTDDNPRTEVPAAIRAEVMAGCPDATEIGDRREAIRVAAAGLQPDDLLVVAGKGHEQGQIVGAEIRPFDDAAEVRAAVAAL